MMCHEAGMIMWVQSLWEPAPLQCRRAKTSKIWHDFWRL